MNISASSQFQYIFTLFSVASFMLAADVGTAICNGSRININNSPYVGTLMIMIKEWGTLMKNN